MDADYPLRLLLVDDQPLVLSGLLAILQANNFNCRIANGGFEALEKLRQTLPDVIITDLGMQQMSGFELLAIVRQRFPQIAVIVLSGEFIVDLEDSGSLMNAFFQKGQYTPEELIAKIDELHSQWQSRPRAPVADPAPRWIRHNGLKFLVATCTDCLRSFPVDNARFADAGLNEAECPSCGIRMTYLLDNIVMKVLDQDEITLA